MRKFFFERIINMCKKTEKSKQNLMKERQNKEKSKKPKEFKVNR